MLSSVEELCAVDVLGADDPIGVREVLALFAPFLSLSAIVVYWKLEVII